MIIYLASPYTHPNFNVELERFETICIVAARLMRDGVLVFSPIAHTHPISLLGYLPKDWDYWQRFDHAMRAFGGEAVARGVGGGCRVIGAGKYDDALTAARTLCGASAAALIVLSGESGSGFACHADIESLLKLPAMLRFMADEIEADLKEGNL